MLVARLADPGHDGQEHPDQKDADGRQRQSEAWQSLLEGRESDERRVGELREEGTGT